VAVAVDRAVEPSPPRGLHAAWGIHLGLLLLAGSALYSKQSPPLQIKQIGLLVVVSLALVLWAALDSRRERLARGLRLLMAFAAVLLWGLARGPHVHSWVAEGQSARDLLEYFQVSLGTIGILVVFLSWLVYYAAGGERAHRPPPLRRAVVSAGEVTILLAVVVYVALFNIYGRKGDLGSNLVIFQALQFMALGSAVLGSSGGPYVRRAPAYYLGAALLGVAAVSLLALKAGGL
jgi:hypothetical protein